MNRYPLIVVALATTMLAIVNSPAAAHPREASAKAVVEQRFAAVMRHDLEDVVALYATGAVTTSPAFCANRIGPDGVRHTYGDLFRDYPNITDEVTAMVVEGNSVAVQFMARVRKPDGSVAFEIPLANFLRVEHGLIVRDDTYFDGKGRPCS